MQFFGRRWTRSALSLATVVVLAATPSQADGWREYVYLSLKFAASFPASPKIEDVDYPAGDGTSVKARRYSLDGNNRIYRITVADFSEKGWDEFKVLDLAAKILLQDGQLKADERCRYNDLYICREMAITQKDGSHLEAAAAFYQHKLYQVEGIIPSTSDDPQSADAIRFLHSFRFTDFAFQ